MYLHQAFATLDLDPRASADDVRRSYRELVKVWHPDRFQGDPALQARASERLRAINEAYDVLQAHFANPASTPPPTATPPATTNDARPSTRVSRIRPIVFFWRPVLVGLVLCLAAGNGRSLALDRYKQTPPRSATAADFLPRPSTPARQRTSDESLQESYASTQAELQERVEGQWKAEYRTYELRQGTVFFPGARSALAFYEPLTHRSLLFRVPGTDQPLVLEVAFTPTSMTWYEGGGLERRLVIEFVRVPESSALSADQ
jgi:DnaJ domain